MPRVFGHRQNAWEMQSVGFVLLEAIGKGVEAGFEKAGFASELIDFSKGVGQGGMGLGVENIVGTGYFFPATNAHLTGFGTGFGQVGPGAELEVDLCEVIDLIAHQDETVMGSAKL